MAKYEKMAEALLPAVGGKENIIYFQHCTTRLRFNVRDRSLVDVKAIEKAHKVVGVQITNAEVQVIVGPMVADAYDELCKAWGMKAEAPIDENLDRKKLTVKGVFTGILDGVSGSIVPLIPMMIGAGMIKVINMMLNLAGVLSTDSSTYIILSWLGDAFTYFFPVFLGATAAKKFGTNMGLGMLLGGLLIFPSFITAVTEGTAMTIFGLPVYMTNYSSTVVPIILTVYVMSLLEKPIRRFCPDILKSFMVPTLLLIIMLPLMLVVLAPLGYYIGAYVSAAAAWIYEHASFAGVALLCAILPLMVMTGMHTMMTPYWVTTFASLGYDAFFMPAMILSNLNQAAACLGVAVKAKNKDIKSSAASCAVTALIPGVTEPAMFGITLRYKRPLYVSLIGNAAAGLVAGLLKVACYAFPGSGGLFAIVTFSGPDGNLFRFLAAMAVGMVTTFVLTYIFGINEEANQK